MFFITHGDAPLALLNRGHGFGPLVVGRLERRGHALRRHLLHKEAVAARELAHSLLLLHCFAGEDRRRLDLIEKLILASTTFLLAGGRHFEYRLMIWLI